jgi:hypothetical protein
MKGEITRKYLVHYSKSMTGKQVTGYERSSLLGNVEALRSPASFGSLLNTKGHDLRKIAVPPNLARAAFHSRVQRIPSILGAFLTPFVGDTSLATTLAPEIGLASIKFAARTRLHIALRLLPFLFILYITNYLERTSVAYAPMLLIGKERPRVSS